MFHGFANVWTVVGMSRELRPKVPLPVQVAGERLVLFRDAAGVAHALVDRCPHRGVKLSLGKVEGGCIECPFHGWKFAGDGGNCHVPWNPDAKRERLGATPVPLRERGGLLWLYTAPGAEAPVEPEVPEVLGRPDVTVCGFSLTWRTHWSRAMENMLDWPHLPFVHATTIGSGMKKKRPDSRMDIAVDDRSWGFHSTITIDGELQQGALDYRFPNAMHLHILESGDRVFEMLSISLPLDDASTRMILITVRNFLRPRILDPLFNYGNHRVAMQDQEVVESSFPAEVPAAAEERSVRTDEPTLRFRKLYRDRLMRSDAAPPNLRPVASLVRPAVTGLP